VKKQIFAALALGLASMAGAHEYKLGTLHIDHPVIRVSSAAAKTGAGFMTINNRGRQADRLVSVTTDASSRADLHGTISNGNVMQMRAQTGGVAIPAGGTISFAPGGLHVMFIGLKAPVPAGRMIKARLQFERAGAVDVMFKAETAGQTHQH
jgi:periplasmic copper chaperone A